MLTNKNAIQLLHRGLENVIDIIYPLRCPVCETPVEQHGQACDDCLGKLKYIVSPFCMICGKQLDDDTREVCVDCAKNKHSFIRGVAVFAYTKEIKQSMYRFKYDGQRDYAYFYADMLVRLKGRIIASWKPDVIVPVPLHKKRYRKRGYNQAALIAYRLEKYLGVPVDENLITREKNTLPQKELDDKERAKNIKNAFHVSSNIVKYKRILLVDDIYTTGATLDACVQAMNSIHKVDVYFAAVCIGRGF